GVSTHRMVRPVLFSACLMLGLSVINQEIIIPSLGTRVLYQRDDPNGHRNLIVNGTYDANGILLSGTLANRQGLIVRDFNCSIPPDVGGGNLRFLQAAQGRWVPRAEGKARTGGWLMTGTQPAELSHWARTDVLEPIAPGKFFLYSDLDF